MDAEIAKLEERLAALLEEHRALREENTGLRSRIKALETDNARMAAKLEAAIERVEALLDSLPEESGEA